MGGLSEVPVFPPLHPPLGWPPMIAKWGVYIWMGVFLAAFGLGLYYWIVID
jgi:drug/metabolite transporter (DMT)-like permease